MSGEQLRAIMSFAPTVIIGLITALWINLNSEIADLKLQFRSMDASMTNLRVAFVEMSARQDKLVDVFNAARKKRQ
jgi:hypothetical protein